MKKIDILGKFLINNIDILEPSSSSGTNPTYPEFDLYPRDFLKFAKVELNHSNIIEDNLIHIINCLSHLKRALDCQLDFFLYQINLYELIKKKNLKFDKKLDFLKKAGVIESSSISRLNYLRNKMEHHYKIPEIAEIEVYFDLVNAFISVIESTTTFFLFNYHVQIESKNEDLFTVFDLGYVFNKNPKITFSVKHKDKTKNFSVDVYPSEQSEFVYYLRALLHIAKLGYMKKEFILEELNYNEDQY